MRLRSLSGSDMDNAAVNGCQAIPVPPMCRSSSSWLDGQNRAGSALLWTLTRQLQSSWIGSLPGSQISLNRNSAFDHHRRRYPAGALLKRIVLFSGGSACRTINLALCGNAHLTRVRSRLGQWGKLKNHSREGRTPCGRRPASGPDDNGPWRGSGGGCGQDLQRPTVEKSWHGGCPF